MLSILQRKSDIDLGDTCLLETLSQQLQQAKDQIKEQVIRLIKNSILTVYRYYLKENIGVLEVIYFSSKLMLLILFCVIIVL